MSYICRWDYIGHIKKYTRKKQDSGCLKLDTCPVCITKDIHQPPSSPSNCGLECSFSCKILHDHSCIGFRRCTGKTLAHRNVPLSLSKVTNGEKMFIEQWRTSDRKHTASKHMLSRIWRPADVSRGTLQQSCLFDAQWF